MTPETSETVPAGTLAKMERMREANKSSLMVFAIEANRAALED